MDMQELIKHDVKVSFPKGKYDQADKLIEVLSKNFKDIPYDEKASRSFWHFKSLGQRSDIN